MLQGSRVIVICRFVIGSQKNDTTILEWPQHVNYHNSITSASTVECRCGLIKLTCG